MGERKVLNKYYPPDFDTSMLKRFGQRNTGYDPFKQIEVRMMLPFSVQCVKCGEFSYRGKKFNSKKENVHGEDYKGIKKVRFYMKCAVCSNIFSIKTDPENGDYEVEFGVTRNFESWMKAKEEDEREAAEQAAEEMGDSMKALENRTLAQKRESDIQDALDEMLALNKRNETVDVNTLLEAREAKRNGTDAKSQEAAKKTAEEIEAQAAKEAAEVFEARRKTIKRIDEDDDSEKAKKEASKWASMFGAKVDSGNAIATQKRKVESGGVTVGAIVKRAKKSEKSEKKKSKKDKKKKKKKDKKDKAEGEAPAMTSATTDVASKPDVSGGDLGLGLGGYGSSSHSD